MNAATRTGALLAMVAVCAAPLQAQMGEVQLGAVLANGTAASFGTGAGVVFGLSAGRLAYVGLRWTTHQGTTASAIPPGGPQAIRTRAQVTALDLGVVIPVGPLEFVPGFSIGAVWFRQRTETSPIGGGTNVTRAHAEELLFAPGLSVEVHAAGVVLIPQLQYYLVGRPDFPAPNSHNGTVASVRLVLPFEMRRIRR